MWTFQGKRTAGKGAGDAPQHVTPPFRLMLPASARAPPREWDEDEAEEAAPPRWFSAGNVRSLFLPSPALSSWHPSIARTGRRPRLAWPVSAGRLISVSVWVWRISSIRRSARSATTHMLHAISRPRSQKTAMMITPIVFPPCIGDSRSLCRSFHTHPVRYRYGGDCEGVRCVGDVSFFVSERRWTGGIRTARYGDTRGRREEKTAGTGSGNPYMGFRRPVPAVCRMVSDVRLCTGCGLVGLIMPEVVKTCEEGQTRPMPGSSGRASSGTSAGSGGWTSWPGASMAMEPSVVFGS